MINVEMLDALLFRSGMTRFDLGVALGLSKNIIYNRINGISEFTNSELRKIKGIFNLSSRDMFRLLNIEDGSEKNEN